MAGAHNYSELHQLIDRLEPDQAEELRKHALRLMAATPRRFQVLRAFDGPEANLGARAREVTRAELGTGSNDVLTLESLRQRRAEVLTVALMHKAHRVAVFGSVARGEASAGSDLDLLVDFQLDATLLDQAGLSQDLEELLGVRVDVVTRNALKPRDERIHAEAVDL